MGRAGPSSLKEFWCIAVLGLMMWSLTSYLEHCIVNEIYREQPAAHMIFRGYFLANELYSFVSSQALLSSLNATSSLSAMPRIAAGRMGELVSSGAAGGGGRAPQSPKPKSMGPPKVQAARCWGSLEVHPSRGCPWSPLNAV